MKNKGYTKFWGANKVHHGEYEIGVMPFFFAHFMLFFLFQFFRFFTFLSVNFALLKVLDTFFAEFNPFFSVLQALFACNYVV